MNLLSNYVAAVKRHLPAHLREDVGDELASTLADSLDAFEESTGRPLTDDEVADVLRRRGHPLLVASAYRGDRSLVGPALFPFYARVILVGLAVIGAIVLVRYFFGFGMHGATAHPRDLLHLFYAVYWPSLAMFTWVTVFFFVADAWIERKRLLQRWDPRELRAVDDVGSRIHVRNPFGDIVVLALLVSVLYDGLHISGRLLKLTTPIVLEVGRAWQAWLLPATLALAVAVIAIGVWNLLRGYWHRATLVVSIGANFLLGLALAVLVLDPRGLEIDLAGAVADGAALTSIIVTAKIVLGIVAASRFVQAWRQLAGLRAARGTAAAAARAAAAP